MPNIFAMMGPSGLYFGICLLIFLVLILILGICVVILFRRLSAQKEEYRELEEKYEQFMAGRDGRSLEESFTEVFEDIRKLKASDRKNRRNIQYLLEQILGCYQKMGLVKYNAFREMGGRLSFSVCMLDAENSGFILNSVHSNNGCYTYAKEIVEGASAIELGDEEQEALNQALSVVREMPAKKTAPEEGRKKEAETKKDQKPAARAAREGQVRPENQPARAAREGQVRPENQPARAAREGQARPENQAARTGREGQVRPENQPARAVRVKQERPENQAVRTTRERQERPESQPARTGREGQIRPENQTARTGREGQVRPETRVVREKRRPVSEEERPVRNPDGRLQEQRAVRRGVRRPAPETSREEQD